MRKRFIAAAVSMFALAMPATAMAAGGGEGGLRTGGSGGADQSATTQTPIVYLAPGSGYDHPAGSPLVRAIQRRLAAAGFAPGPIDGLYGPRTEAATARYQAAIGLQADGIAGPHTLTALSSPTPVLYPGAGYGAEPSRPVADLQRLLRRAGYEPGHVDGRYGPRTEQAVRRFQAAHRLRVDGIAHPRAFIDLRDQLQAGNHARLAGNHRTTGPARTHPAIVHPTISSPEPVHASGPTLVGGTRRHSGGPSVAWVWLLVAALAAGLLMVAAVRTRRRRDAASGSPANAPVPVDGPTPERPPLARDDGADPEKAFRLGVLSEERNDLTAAEAAYRRADRQGHAAAASNLGVLLERRDDRAGAKAAYHRADQRGDPNGAFNLAMLLEEQSELAGAEAAYRRADLQGHAAAASNLGVLLERRGDLAGAEAAYRRADQRGDPNGAFNLAVLLEEQRDLAGAEAAYRRADERGPAEVANAARAALLSLRASLSGQHAANEGGLHAG